MSMFHELMMRKKEKIMYATIKGSLTENDGVFSGFSNINYLQTQQNFDVSQTNWEFVIKASKASTGNARLFCINNGNGAMHTIFSLTSFSCTILTTTLTISQNFTADNFYFFKIKRNGNILSLSWSSDGIIYQDEQSAEVTNWGNSGYVFYGRVAGLSTAGYGGSIDLPNSYIKLGSTKYNLQAVVGYTIVGSPTITDGVVSGFSSANYLKLPAVSNFNKYEYRIKFRINSLANGTYAVSGTASLYSRWGFNLQVTSSNKRLYSYLRYQNNGTWQESATTVFYEFQIDTDYYAKVILKNNTYQIFISLDNVSWIEGNKAVIPDGVIFAYPIATANNAGLLVLGAGTQYAVFDGSIDLNETYIKINNKLWFNGQSAQ